MSKINTKQKWSKEEEELLMNMFYNDKSYEEIGAKLGRSYSSVAGRKHIIRKKAGEAEAARRLALKKTMRVIPNVKKPAAIKVAEKVLESSLIGKKIREGSHDALKQLTRLVLHAEMLETQNTALKVQLAKIEKALRD